MIFAAPWVLLGLAALPALWWLLRVTPPAPRVQDFPAIRLLAGLRAREQTAARTPLWLLLLRTVAAALLVVGLAAPVLDAAGALPGAGPLILVMDDGWAAGTGTGRSGSPTRRRRWTGRSVQGRPAALLTTARSGQGCGPGAVPDHAGGRAAAEARRPASPALAAGPGGGRRGAGGYERVRHLHRRRGWRHRATRPWPRAMAKVGPVTELAPGVARADLMLAARAEADRLVARVALLPGPATDLAVLAQSGDGRTLARVAAHVPAGAAEAELPIALPPGAAQPAHPAAAGRASFRRWHAAAGTRGFAGGR